jgi:hypothetical protein
MKRIIFKKSYANKNLIKKQDLEHYAKNPFFRKVAEKYSEKNENWTILKCPKSKNQKRIHFFINIV